MSILDLDAVYAVFCSVDTFWRTFEPFWERELLATGRQRRSPPLTSQRDHDHRHPLPSLGLPHLQSVLHAVGPGAVAGQWREEFPQLVSYNRFVELLPRVLLSLTVYLHTQFGACTGISFIDSTALSVCRPVGVPSCSHPPASGLPCGCPARQDVGRLVRWLQTSPGGQ